jgi:transcriptional regulator with XRE-family HTH domain
LPFARVSLKSLILNPYDFVPISVGDHIRKRRLELGLPQGEAAQHLGVNPWTVLNWEKGHTEPPVSAMPAIFRFLDCDTHPEPKTLPERLLAKRREKGWSIKKAADSVGVDHGTWANWEQGRVVLYRRHRVLIAKTLGLSFEALDQEMTARWNQLHRCEL